MMKRLLSKGDIILLSNDPKSQNNWEQKGKRPWLVVSQPELNKNSPFVWAIPFTSTYRDYPLAYRWDDQKLRTVTKGTLLCAQLCSLDVYHRDYKFLEHTSVPAEVDYMIKAVLGFA